MTDAAELRLALRRSIETGDAARRRVTRDLHDGPQQQLVACVISLQLAQQSWSSDPTKARQRLDSGLEHAQSALDALRDLVVGIHPPVLTDLGLRAAVEALAARLPIPVSVDVTAKRLATPVEASLYFLVAEALADVVDHAEASSAAIRIALDGRRVTVEVSGGSSTPAVGDRVTALDGELTISSAPASGTILHAEIPLPATPA